MGASEYIKRVEKFRAYKSTERINLLKLRLDTNKGLRKEYHKWFRTLDVIMLIMLLMNFGALFMTGVLVMKVNPNIELKEANPAQCKWNGWSCHENAKDLFPTIMKLLITWGVIAAWYIGNRYTIYSVGGLWMLTVALIILVMIIGMDFTNDLGLYVGKILYAKVVG